MNELFFTIIGDDLEKFVAQFGGTTLAIPKKPNAPLKKVLGDDKARVFCCHFGGESLYVAKKHREYTTAKQHAFCQAVAQEINLGVERGQAIRRQAKLFYWTQRWGQKLFARHEDRRFMAKQLVFDW